MLAYRQIDDQANQVSGFLADLDTAIGNYYSMVEDMEARVAEAQIALVRLKTDRLPRQVLGRARPMTDGQRYIVWSALDDLNAYAYDIDVATDSVGWTDNAELRREVVASIDRVGNAINELDTLRAAHPALRFSITPDVARSRLDAMSSQLADVDARREAAITTAADVKNESQQLWDRAQAEAEKVDVSY